MKIALIAAGALTFAATAASAQTMMTEDVAPMEQQVVIESPSEATNYQFHDGGSSVAPGFTGQNDTEAKDWTPNMGAGTSRTNHANNG